MRGTPVAALQVECGEPPLDIRRRRLLTNLAIKSKLTPNNPTSEAFFPPADLKLPLKWKEKHLRNKQEKQSPNGKIMKVEIVHRCHICRKDIKARQMAKPSGCNHYFCVPCLEKWSKTRNCCPVDEIKFSEADILDRRTLKVIKNANIRNVVKYRSCSICSDDKWQDTIIDCDRCLLKFHIGCLRNHPTLHIGSWLCQTCEPLGFENVNFNDALSRLLQKHLAIKCYRNMQTH